MGRSGRAALKPVNELTDKDGGAITREVKDCLRWWSSALRAIAPRLILSLEGKEPAHPVRIYSDATGAGKLSSVSFIPNDEGHRPILLAAQADENLHKLATTAKKLYISELFAPSLR